MIEKIQFDKTDEGFIKLLEKVTDLNKKLSNKDSQDKNNEKASFEIQLSKYPKFVDIKRVETEIGKETFDYLSLVTDTGQEYSISRLFDIAYKGNANNIKFKGSSKTSKLQGAGVLANSESVNKDLLSFASKYGLSRLELATALINRDDLVATETNVITYFPVIGDDENPTDERFQADYLNQLHADKKDIEGLKTVKKYVISFKPQ